MSARRKKKNKGLSKGSAEKEHFKKRFKERFDTAINRIDIKYIIDCIKNECNCTFISQESARVSKYRMRVKDHICIIIYDANRNVPITCYKP